MPTYHEKRAWKFRQLLDEMQSWTTYLDESAERFKTEMYGYKQEATLREWDDVWARLLVLKKESALLKSRLPRLKHTFVISSQPSKRQQARDTRLSNSTSK